MPRSGPQTYGSISQAKTDLEAARENKQKWHNALKSC